MTSTSSSTVNLQQELEDLETKRKTLLQKAMLKPHFRHTWLHGDNVDTSLCTAECEEIHLMDVRVEELKNFIISAQQLIDQQNKPTAPAVQQPTDTEDRTPPYSPTPTHCTKCGVSFKNLSIHISEGKEVCGKCWGKCDQCVEADFDSSKECGKCVVPLVSAPVTPPPVGKCKVCAAPIYSNLLNGMCVACHSSPVRQERLLKRRHEDDTNDTKDTKKQKVVDLTAPEEDDKPWSCNKCFTSDRSLLTKTFIKSGLCEECSK